MKRSASVEAQASRQRRRATSDTIIVPAREEGFNKVFLGENRWYQVRIGPAMKERLKFIAAYQVAPISAITHIARIKEIVPYEDTGKYEIIFSGAAEKITDVKLTVPRMSPQGPLYCKRDDLMAAKTIEEVLS